MASGFIIPNNLELDSCCIANPKPDDVTQYRRIFCISTANDKIVSNFPGCCWDFVWWLHVNVGQRTADTSERHLQRVAQEPHKRPGGGEGLGDVIGERVLQRCGIVHVGNGDEIGAPQVFNTGVIGRETQRTFLQAVSVECEKRLEFFVVFRTFPSCRIVNDGLADLSQDAGFGTPQTGGQKACPRFEMNVKPRCVNIPAKLMAKLDADVRFVRFVGTMKSRVAVNPHQRTARPPVNGREILRNFLQTRTKRPNEGQTRFQHVFFVLRFVFLKPRPIIVFRKLLEKLKKRRLEVLKFHDSVP